MYRQAGFTLLELMVVLAIAGIMMAIGVPSFQNITTTNRAAANTNDLITALSLARSEAVKRSAAVSVCKSADGEICTTSGNWDQGWIVRVDSNNEVLRVFGSLGGNTTLTSGDHIVTFTGLGALDEDEHNGTVSFDLKAQSGSTIRDRCVSVNLVGRASSEKDSCN